MTDSTQTVRCLMDTLKVAFPDCTICNHHDDSLLNLNWPEAIVFIFFILSLLGFFAIYKYYKNEKLRHDEEANTLKQEKAEKVRELADERDKSLKLEKENEELKKDIDELLILVRKAFISETKDEKSSAVLDFEKKYYNLLKDYHTFKNSNNDGQ